MELEAVELIMAVEEEFRIEIPDRVAQVLLSVRQLSEFVEAELRRLHRDIEAAVIMRRVSDIAAIFRKVPSAAVCPDTMLIEDPRLKYPRQEAPHREHSPMGAKSRSMS